MMGSQESQDSPSLISSKYEVLGLAGRGGTGVVYKVRHVALDTIFALKVLPAEFRDNTEIVNRFHQEARVMARFNHPNIVRVSDVDKDGNTPYFVMEYIEGQSLSEYLAACGPLSVQEALSIARQVTLALDYAHSHPSPVIHRDIKPQNILIETYSKRAVVTDFGIAKVRGASIQTSTDLMLGTLLYCAPEQILPTIEIDGRADLYSLGLVLYEMVAHRPFFADLDERTLLGKMLYGLEDNIPVFATQVFPEFAFLVRRAISRKPEDRYQGAKDLLKDIDACLALPSSSLDSQVLIQPSADVSAETVHLQREALVPPEEPLRAFIQKSLVNGRRHRALLGSILAVVMVGVFLFLVSSQTESESELARSEMPLVVPRSQSAIPIHETARGTVAEIIWERAREIGEETPGKPTERTTEVSEVQPQEQPLPSPRRYRVTTRTAVRENPAWASDELSWLKPRTRIYVVAHAGDWLKVESHANPPKPPGYVWKNDAQPE